MAIFIMGFNIFRNVRVKCVLLLTAETCYHKLIKIK